MVVGLFIFVSCLCQVVCVLVVCVDLLPGDLACPFKGVWYWSMYWFTGCDTMTICVGGIHMIVQNFLSG